MTVLHRTQRLSTLFHTKNPAAKMVGLRLDFTPVQPSHLRHSYTPRSPASPLESIPKRMRRTEPTASSDSSSDSDSSTESVSSGPPPSPCKWMWYCHECRTGYELGVTRRCLIDDHELCYGQPVKRISKKGKKKHRACQSEFDYIGWQNWGAWKRMQTGREDRLVERNCSAHCDWPSQCRWAHKKMQEQPAEDKCQAVQEVAKETVQEVARGATTPQTEAAPVAATNERTTQALKSTTESPLARVATVARNLTSRWTSLLAPIEEESASATIEDFLDSHKTKDNSTSTTREANPLLQNSRMTGFSFDFTANTEQEKKVPSLAGGLHDLVARTVGIALLTPSKTCLEQKKGPICEGPGVKHRRCVSAPATQKQKLQEQLLRKRRMSA